MTFNLDTLAVEAEAGEPFHFEWNGEQFTMPTLAQMDWRDQSKFWDDDQTSEDRVRLLLGTKQFAGFTQKRASTARVSALLDAWMAFQGADLGESEASSDS